MVEVLYIFMDQACEDYALENAEPIPFRWNVYRQRPQLRYSFASQLIREIVDGSPVGSYLLSLPQMVKRSHLPLMTVRHNPILTFGR